MSKKANFCQTHQLSEQIRSRSGQKLAKGHKHIVGEEKKLVEKSGSGFFLSFLTWLQNAFKNWLRKTCAAFFSVFSSFLHTNVRFRSRNSAKFKKCQLKKLIGMEKWSPGKTQFLHICHPFSYNRTDSLKKKWQKKVIFEN